MANLVTFIRLFLLLIVLPTLFFTSEFWLWTTGIICFIMLHLDLLDGWIARRWNCSTTLGAAFDATVDRSTEISLFVVFAYLNYVPIWVALFFILRNHFVDMIRSLDKNFRQQHSRLDYFIDHSAFSRFLTQFMKGWLIGLILIRRVLELAPATFWNHHSETYMKIFNIMLYSTVFLCIFRVLPLLTRFIKNNVNFFEKANASRQMRVY